MLNAFCVTRVLKLEFSQQMYGSLMIFHPAVLYILKAKVKTLELYFKVLTLVFKIYKTTANFVKSCKFVFDK